MKPFIAVVLLFIAMLLAFLLPAPKATGAQGYQFDPYQFITTKGDLIVFTGTGFTRLSAPQGYVLIRDTNNATGWTNGLAGSSGSSGTATNLVSGAYVTNLTSWFSLQSTNVNGTRLFYTNGVLTVKNSAGQILTVNGTTVSTPDTTTIYGLTNVIVQADEGDITLYADTGAINIRPQGSGRVNIGPADGTGTMIVSNFAVFMRSLVVTNETDPVYTIITNRYIGGVLPGTEGFAEGYIKWAIGEDTTMTIDAGENNYLRLGADGSLFLTNNNGRSGVLLTADLVDVNGALKMRDGPIIHAVQKLQYGATFQIDPTLGDRMTVTNSNGAFANTTAQITNITVGQEYSFKVLGNRTGTNFTFNLTAPTYPVNFLWLAGTNTTLISNLWHYINVEIGYDTNGTTQAVVTVAVAPQAAP